MTDVNDGNPNAILEQYDASVTSAIAEAYKQREAITKQEKKRTQQVKEIAEIYEAIASGNYSTKRDRIAGILNMFPDSRDSDVTLTIKYWDLFQPELYQAGHFTPFDLFKLERLTTIARLRAKIQNEYGLFLGSEDVRNKRRQREEEIKSEMVSDTAPRRLISVYADETGKNGQFVIIGAVWFLDVRKGLTFQMLVDKWKRENNWKQEFHFANCGKRDLEAYIQFIDLVATNRDYIGIKFISVDQTGSTRSIEDTVQKLYWHLLLKGFAHEVNSGRATLPRQIDLTIDQSDGCDAISREEIKTSLSNEMTSRFGEGTFVGEIQAVDSKHSAAIQLADLVSGAINRKLNHSGSVGHKDQLADYIISKLELKLGQSSVDDSSAFISL